MIFTLWRVRLPLLHAHHAAHGSESVRDLILVNVVRADGLSGWGECSALSTPGYTGEHVDGAWAALRDEIVPSVLRGDDPGSATGNPMAWAGVRDALLDAELRAVGVSLVEHLGVERRPVETTTVVSAAGTDGASLDGLAERVAATFGPIKVKVAPGADLDVVRAVRSAAPGRLVAADANGSYRADDADALARLDDLGLWYLEQPCPDLPTNAAAAAHLATPVALDESIGSLDDLRAAIEARALDILNLKPARVGGLAVAHGMLGVAAEAGLDVFVGGMLESGVGRAGAVALAMDRRCTLPTDLGPSERYFAPDVTEPIAADARGRLLAPEGPGLGRVPLEERLASTAVDHLVVGA